MNPPYKITGKILKLEIKKQRDINTNEKTTLKLWGETEK